MYARSDTFEEIGLENEKYVGALTSKNMEPGINTQDPSFML